MAEPSRDDAAFNQSPPFADVNLFASDSALREAVRREGAAWAAADLQLFGGVTGSATAIELGRRANAHPPELQNFDAKGRRVDHVAFHPAYHEVMAISMAQGLHCSTWEHLLTGEKPKPGAHVARAAGSYMAAQMEPGHCCPITMTHAAVASLRHAPSLAAEWLPKILSRTYDPGAAPAKVKSAVTLGMGMTERQGGTDVRANTTRAEPLDGADPGAPYAITGHKWFLSAPMSDAFLVLAQAKGGLSCFLLSRLNEDGTLNGLRLVRLKDKLGNRSNASSEVEFEGARAFLVGEEGRGVATIIDMVTLTRLDCAVSSAGLMRQALARAIHHARHRSVFQRLLIDQPLMTQVLADMALDVEAATALSFRLARAFDGGAEESEAAYRRMMTPVTKYWVCKTAPGLAYEAMECLGGNGYVEEGGFPLLYREVPVNAIWEGSGNVMCLDVLRVLERAPETVMLVLEAIGEIAAGEPRLKTALERIETLLAQAKRDQSAARALVEELALAQAGALLLAHSPPAVSDAYLATRLEGRSRNTYGADASKIDARAILDRAGLQLA
ncbi:MAG: isovaleryl-CoA dehydrogenase [Methyloceanibacter sp.]|uniref:isovaleryl-CoA dehydrogenase n=1 Tax=Methyloceanibacter sp. TaxID=1965321 RepID=UPI003D6C7BF2